MINTIKKSLLVVATCLVASVAVQAETWYIVSGKCNVPLTAGMNNSKYQIFKWDGTSAQVTTDISSSVTNTGGSYYNSTSLAVNDLKTLSKYGTSSTSSRTMQAIKLAGSTTLTITLGTKTFSKVIVVGRANSSDNLTIDILGQTQSTSNKNFFCIEKEGSYTGSIAINNTTSKEYNFFIYLLEGQAAPVVSTDATLSALTYNGTSVPNFSAQTEHYDVELPAGTTTVPTVAGTANESHATVSVTPATNLPGTTTIVVTAQDGTTTKTYSITFTVASSKPKVLTATWANIQGTANIDNVNLTIKGKVKNGSSLTVTPQFTGNNIASWTPTGAKNFSNGSILYEFSASTGHMSVYEVTITEADPVSSDATLKWLKYGDASVPNFSPDTYVYNIEMNNGIKTPPTITAETNDPKATKVITQAQSVPGSGTVVVTAQDGTTQLTYTVNYTVEVPQSDLTLHVPEIYEAKEIAGGYGGTLAVFSNREYEVYYAGKTSDSYMTVDVRPCQKQPGIATTSSATACEAKDGWFKATGNSISNYTFPGTDEFSAGEGCMHKIFNNNNYKFRIQGYDQFSFYGKDNSTTIDPNNASKNKRFQVYIDNVLQPENPSSSPSIRRYNITTGEHVIEVRGIGGSNNEFYGWSLRLAQEPRTKWLKGNDSTQVVLQTNAIKPITYVTKYNNIPGGETRLEWIGTEANGITLSKIDGALTDTLIVNGNANCATGTYNYAVVAYYNNVETNRATGSFTVTSDIQATSDTIVKVYNGEEMDQITFKYYALSANNVQLTWPNGQPNGISGSSPSDGKYIIGGTPQITGTLPQEFPYSITVEGSQTVIQGKITVEKLEYGDKSVLYLYKNNLAYEQDAVYNYIKNAGKWNLVTRKQKEDGLRPAEQYANYKWVLISEDVDADNTEVIQVIRGGANLPVLNLKGFTYASERLGWGHPDNGAVDSTATKNKGCKLFIQQPTHPIFAANLSYLRYGDSIAILSNYERNGIMPIEITGQATQGSLCLATGYTRDIENYYGYGAQQTALHEVPASMRGGHKYICLPLARNVTLNGNGPKLIEGIITYLTSPDDSGIEAPLPQINSFSLFGFAATINQADNTILLSLPQEKYEELEGAEPEIVMADAHTHIETNASSLQYAIYLPKVYVVSDYITRRAYSLTIELYDPQGIDEVYEAGMWVNIYDIYGRKVTTTNEDVYTMDLPQGMYIIVTESGKTLKIMR